MNTKRTCIVIKSVILCLTVMATSANGRNSGIPAASRHSAGTSHGGPAWIASSLGETDPLPAEGSTDEQEVFSGQSNRPISLVVQATPDIINEGESIQLTATFMQKGSPRRQVRSDSVVWTIISGPAASLSPSGLLTTDSVYQNEVIVYQGWYAGILATGILIVQDSDKDNYGSYGSDGIDDDWQVGNFGDPPNANASPNANPDGDPDNNMMEFLTGFDPNDPNDWFQLVILDCDGSTSVLKMNKVIPNRLYTVQAGTDLTNYSGTVTSFTCPVEELDMVVEDAGFAAPRKFYRVDVKRL